MLAKRIAPQSEVIRAILLEDSLEDTCFAEAALLLDLERDGRPSRRVLTVNSQRTQNHSQAVDRAFWAAS